jgi:hypothetical protein
MKPLNNLLREEDMKVIFGGIKVSFNIILKEKIGFLENPQSL